VQLSLVDAIEEPAGGGSDSSGGSPIIDKTRAEWRRPQERLWMADDYA
jgi:hypothetical protein